MATQKFSKGEAIRFGWNIFKSNIGFFILLMIIVGLISYVPGAIAEKIKEQAVALSVILNIISFVISILVSLGLIKITLKFCDNEKTKISDLFSCLPLFFKYLFASIVYGLIVLGGLILLIIPGIIWGIRFQFYGYFIVDKGFGPIESLKKSFAVTRGSTCNLFLFGLLLLCVYILGLLALIIGLFAAIPTAVVAIAFVYRKLLTQTESVNELQRKTTIG